MKEVNIILNDQLNLIKLDKEDFEKINNLAKEFLKELKERLKKSKIKADVFIGGSLAKNTLVKKDVYDIDIFVRFDKSYGNKISEMLEKILKDVKKVHGSRDYYHKIVRNIIIEIIPVIKISKPEQALNVTDLSYFHVNYILNKLKKNKKLAGEISLAKTFTFAQNCYGAESYIHGFSGYALELLICHYGSFMKFVRNMAELDISKKKLIIDAEKLYGKNNVLDELNKSKSISPIILIDPTFKERNSLSSLSSETFYKFQNACKMFLKKPSSGFFIRKKVEDDFKKHKKIMVVRVKTKKQAGDIAGTKSKKFFKFFISKLNKEFEIKKSGFDYSEKENIAKFYLVLDKKKPTTIRGPPIDSKNNFSKFKKKHPDMFIRKGFAYFKLKHEKSFEDWFKLFLKKDKKIIRDMDIDKIIRV